MVGPACAPIAVRPCVSLPASIANAAGRPAIVGVVADRDHVTGAAAVGIEQAQTVVEIERAARADERVVFRGEGLRGRVPSRGGKVICAGGGGRLHDVVGGRERRAERRLELRHRVDENRREIRAPAARDGFRRIADEGRDRRLDAGDRSKGAALGDEDARRRSVGGTQDFDTSTIGKAAATQGPPAIVRRSDAAGGSRTPDSGNKAA